MSVASFVELKVLSAVFEEFQRACYGHKQGVCIEFRLVLVLAGFLMGWFDYQLEYSLGDLEVCVCLSVCLSRICPSQVSRWHLEWWLR